MDCCLLSAEEVGQLRNYGILPNHDNHIHIDFKTAFDRVLDETYELVRGLNGRDYVTLSRLYYLRALPSGGRGAIPIIQRVVSNQPKHLTPIRY
jgi:hypothetical protein